MQSKQKPCASIAARFHGAVYAAVGYSTRSIFYFRNFANGSERKGLSAFTGKFPSSTAVFNTSCLRKKITFSPLSFGRKFSHAITIDTKHLYFTVGVSSTPLFLLQEINCFLETLSSFCIFELKKPCFLILGTGSLRLDTRDSILERFKHRGTRIESQGSSFECQLTFEQYCMLN